MAKFLDYDGLVHYTSCFKPTLVDLVDNGAKNLIPMTRDDIKAANPAYTWNGYTATVAGLSFTVNEDLSVTISGTTSTTPYELLLLPRSKGVSFLSNGDYVLSGGYSGTYETTLQVGVNRTSGGSGVRYATYIGTPVEFTVSDAPAANGVWIAVTNDSPGLQINATVKPMICTKSAWNISQKFVPYRPTYEETVEQVAENENNISSQQNTVAQGGNGYALINGIRQYTGDTVTPPVPPNSLWLKDSVKVKTDNYFNADDFSAIQVDAQGNKRNGTNCGILPQGTYTLSATISAPHNDLFHTIKSGSTYNLVTITELPYTFTADGTSEHIIRVANATTTSWAENGYTNIMLNTGSTAESYTPYWTDVIDEKINPLENNILTLETMNGAKNLMHYDSIDDTRTTGTITATLNSDMTITINGTSGDTPAVIGFVFPLKSGEYWLNGCPTDGSFDTYSTDIRNQIYGSIIYGRDTGSGGTVNISDDGNYAYNIRIASHTTINNMIFMPMLISSDIKNAGFTNYQPYAMSNAELTAKEQVNENNISNIQTTVASYHKASGTDIYFSETEPTGNIPANSYWISTAATKIYHISANLLDWTIVQDHYNIDFSGYPVAYSTSIDDRCATTTPIDVSNYDSVTLSFISNDITIIYSLFNDSSLLGRVVGGSSPLTISTLGATSLYLCWYKTNAFINKTDITDAMLNSGDSALPYEDYGNSWV